MSLTFGFYNSVDGDRVYDATQFASIFDGIINDGVFASVGHALTINAVTGGGMEVIARSGRCWFNSSWLYNDSDLDLTITAADLVYPRIDIVAVEINSTESVRKNDIVVLTGTPAATPVAPTLVSTDKVHQYALAEIAVAANVTEITAANITNKVGTTNTPFVTGILEVISIEDLLTQWTASFNDFMTDFETQKQTEFNTWFDHMKGQLSTDAAGHLQNEIDAKAVVAYYTATVGTTWVDQTGYFTQDVAVTGILATDTPVIDIVPVDGALDEDISDEYGKIYKCVSKTDTITLYSSEALTLSLPIKIMVVR